MNKSSVIKALSLVVAVIVSLASLPSYVYGQDTSEAETTSIPTYILYVHEDCPHCKVVEAFIADNSLEDQIDSRELKNNDGHMKELEALWDEFKIPDNERGWPFMLIDNNGKRNYTSGDTPIISELGNTFGISVPDPSTSSGIDTSTPDSSAGDSLLLIVGGVVVFAVVGYAIYSSSRDAKK